MAQFELQNRAAKSPAIPRAGRLDVHKYIAYRVKRNTSLRAKALRALGGFLVLMLLFTLLSRAADEMTIPKVKLESPQKRSLEHKVSGSGKVRENGAKSVTAQAGVRVARIPVEVGSQVKKDDVLFVLDKEDLQEKLEKEQEELKKLELDLSDQESRQAVSNTERNNAVNRAQQDYSDAAKDADKQIQQAQTALNTAKNRLEEYRNNRPSYDLAALQSAVDQAKAAVTQAETGLEALRAEVELQAAEARAGKETPEEQDAAEQAVRTARKGELDTAALKVENAKQQSLIAEDALAKASAAGDNSQEQALQDAITAAQQAYDQAVSAKDTALKSAGRAVEDAQKPVAADSTGEKNRMALKEQTEKVEKFQALIDAEGAVRAPFDGVVTKLDVTVGAPTPEGTALLLADGSAGSTFVAQVPKEQEKYLDPGTAVTLKPGGDKAPVTGLVVESVQVNDENPDMLDVIVRLPDNSLQIGAICTLEAVQQTKNYDQCVPFSALHEENGTYYLLISQEKDGILGSELTATRLNVEILEKNDQYAALVPGALASDQKYIAESSKPVEAGDKVRLKAE